MSTAENGRIKKLSPLLICQIAAGEVVERPASVVKELLENSIDAGATRIVVQTWQGGTTRIDVQDNGCGIHADDLHIAMMRHTTSKITTDDALGGVNTLGFRGEALASIAAVSRFSIASSSDDTGIGQQITIEGNSLEAHAEQTANNEINSNQKSSNQIDIAPSELSMHSKPVAMQQGTRVSVQGLFFNVPARRRFLKSVSTEFAHIETIIKRLALSYFDIGFELWHQGKLIVSVNPVYAQKDSCTPVTYAQKQRLEQLLGNEFAVTATPMYGVLPLDEAAVSSHYISGWLSLSEQKKTAKNKQQLWFVNGRLVQNRMLKQLVQDSFINAIESVCSQQHWLTETNPSAQAMCVRTLGALSLDYVLFLHLPQELINVNIHPTKLDIGFDNEQHICSLVTHYVQKQLVHLLTNNAQPWLQIANEKAQAQSRLNFGKPVFWNKKQLLSQNSDGFLLIDSQKPIAVDTAEQAQQMLEQWQQDGIVPADVEVKQVSFEQVAQLATKYLR